MKQQFAICEILEEFWPPAKKTFLMVWREGPAEIMGVKGARGNLVDIRWVRKKSKKND